MGGTTCQRSDQLTAKMPHHSSQVSSDLIWEIVGAQNAFLVKRAQSGGVRFSRDPMNLVNKTTFGGNKTTRKTYKAIVSSTAKSGYRPDLRAPAVARASAIRFSQRPKKDTPEAKVRGAKAKKAAAAKDE